MKKMSFKSRQVESLKKMTDLTPEHAYPKYDWQCMIKYFTTCANRGHSDQFVPFCQLQYLEIGQIEMVMITRRDSGN